MKGTLKLCFVAAFSLLAPCARGAPALTAYFIPSEVETYLPVTPTSIACAAWEKWTIADAAHASDLMVLVSHGEKGEFDDHRVRMMIFRNDKVYYVDQNGMALAGNSTHKIDPKKIADFRQSLSSGEIENLKESSNCIRP
jgi:hypothetical protein